MSLWGEMRQKSAGKQTRKENKYLEDLKKAGRYKKILENGVNPEIWKGLYSMDPIHIDEDNKRDLIKEIDDFRWDESRRPIRSGDYYIIDYFSQL